MLTKRMMLLLGIGVAGMTAGLIVLGQPKVPVSTKEFMREKLDYAQKVLEAIALEDYASITKNSKKLSAMSQEATWQVFQNPDYAQHSVTFRRHVDALAKAAENKNLDGATLAYVRMTMSCVDCHKLVRGKLVASLD